MSPMIKDFSAQKATLQSGTSLNALTGPRIKNIQQQHSFQQISLLLVDALLDNEAYLKTLKNRHGSNFQPCSVLRRQSEGPIFHCYKLIKEISGIEDVMFSCMQTCFFLTISPLATHGGPRFFNDDNVVRMSVMSVFEGFGQDRSLGGCARRYEKLCSCQIYVLKCSTAMHSMALASLCFTVGPQTF